MVEYKIRRNRRTRIGLFLLGAVLIGVMLCGVGVLPAYAIPPTINDTGVGYKIGNTTTWVIPEEPAGSTTLTFYVEPDRIYTEGKATQSEPFWYQVLNGDYNVTGSVNQTESLMQEALFMFNMNDGLDNDVWGQTLINNSSTDNSLTITLKNEQKQITVYTIRFLDKQYDPTP